MLGVSLARVPLSRSLRFVAGFCTAGVGGITESVLTAVDRSYDPDKGFFILIFLVIFGLAGTFLAAALVALGYHLGLRLRGNLPPES